MNLDWIILHGLRVLTACPLLDFWMPRITALGNSGVVWVVAAIVLLCTKKYRRYGVMLLVGLAAALLLGNLALKNLFARPRPCWLDESVPLLIARPSDYSFPSGHTMAGAIGATILTAADRRFGWAAIPLEYCRITAAGLGKLFRQWDTVTVQGAAAETAGQSPELNGDQIVYDMGEDWLRVRCTPQGEYFYGTLVQNAAAAQWQSMDGKQHRSVDAAQTVSMERRVPELDFVTECDNRVWGCNSRENVIYGCKLGDPTNWFSYRGIAADSYAVTVGSDGAFTGAASCMGYALFFKENTLHKLYGSKPSDFQLSSLRCRGVAKNAARSLCVLNETLYYLSPDGVMAWDGSLPTKVSGALDAAKLANVQSAVGGALDGRYYLHISRESARLLVYDTEKGLWSEEDVCSCDMTSTGGQLYLWDGQALWAADPTREPDWQSTDGVETDIPFELVTGDVGLDGTEQRYLSRLTLRLDAERTSTVEVAVSYDGGAWETVATLAAQGRRRSYDLPFVPRRCGSLRLRLRGKGQITLRSLVRTIAPAKGKLWEEDTSWQA